MTLIKFVTYYFFQVLVPKEDGLLGKMLEVVIIETGKHFLKAKILKDGDMYTPSIAEPLPKGHVSGVQTISQETASSTSWISMAICGLIIAVLFRVLYIVLQQR